MNIELIAYATMPNSTSFTFAIEGISCACASQLERYKTASYNQQSRKGVNIGELDFVIPESIKNHEKTWDEKGKADLEKWFTNAMEGLSELYHELLSYGIPEEDARYILPNACKTNFIVTVNAHELRPFFEYWLCNKTQWEVKWVAEMMLELVKEIAPGWFGDAGPGCERLGYCPEKCGCGRMPKKVVE